jgi:DNA/RNA endonuclease YhcR with UshA esterase domain
MKGQVKFLIWIVILGIGITAAALYQNGSFTAKQKTPTPVEATAETETEESQPIATEAQGEKTLNIDTINKSMVGDWVTVTGEITNRRDHENGHIFLTVKDDSGEIPVSIFSDKNIESETLTTGSVFQFSGSVDEFNGEIELIPSKQADVIPKANKIEEKDAGQISTITGKIITKYSHPEGHLFLTIKVDITGQELEVPLFNSLHPNPDNYPINSLISTKGKITLYKKKLQVIPDSLSEITVLNKGDDTAINTVRIKDISESKRGEMVITKGYVKDVVEKDAHLYFTLSDGEKDLKTVMFKADSQEIAGRKERVLSAEKAQFEIRVLGMVDVYNGELEIIIDKIFND